MLSYVSAYNGGTLTLIRNGIGCMNVSIPRARVVLFRAIPWEVQHSASAKQSEFKKRCCDPVTTEDLYGSNEIANEVLSHADSSLAERGWRYSLQLLVTGEMKLCDVGSSHPGPAAGAKGGAARPLKGNVSWV